MMDAAVYVPDETDRRLIKATQAGLPLCRRPYRALAEELGIEAQEVEARFKKMLAGSVIRRIGAVPNHYALGYRANGMSVWDVPDADVSQAGAMVGALDFVSHSYRRPRHLPEWPFNLYAMVHGKDRAEVEEKVSLIATKLKGRERGHKVLYSTHILKKTGLRLVD